VFRERQTGIDDVFGRAWLAQFGGGGGHFPDGFRIAVKLRTFSAIISAAPAWERTSAFRV
jgi:hypothetical protein